jgi:pilus assembly protein CpaF
VLPPVAVDGPCLAVRRFTARPLPLTAFTTDVVAELLGEVVSRRCNVLVSGATSTGKTTLLGSLVAVAGAHERIVTLEDVAELRLPAAHVLRLEARPATLDGPPAIELHDLLRIALRLRPDRLVVGEVRGDEAADLVQAMNTGHDGSLATIHANSAIDALARLGSLVVHRHPGWPLHAVREHVDRAIDIVVHVARDAAGRRFVDTVGEVVHDAGTPAVRFLATRHGVLDRPARWRR